jgi:hypothetical protein
MAMKRGIELLGKIPGMSPSKSEGLAKELLAEFEKDVRMKGEEAKVARVGTPATASSGSLSGTATPSTAGSSSKSGGQNHRKGGGGGGGGGRRPRKANNEIKHKLGEGSTETRMGTLEMLMLLCMRMLCIHDNEHRREARETQQVYKLANGSAAKEELKEEHEDWRKAIPEKSEEEQFPRHPEGPLRFFSFRRLFEAVRKRVIQVGTGGATAAVWNVEFDRFGEEEKKNLLNAMNLTINMNVIKDGVLRFYKLRDGTEETEENKGQDATMEMWVVKLAPNASGAKLKSAIALLDSCDITDKISMTISQDRAPKGGIMRNLEGALGKYYGNNK